MVRVGGGGGVLRMLWEYCDMITTEANIFFRFSLSILSIIYLHKKNIYAYIYIYPILGILGPTLVTLRPILPTLGPTLGISGSTFITLGSILRIFGPTFMILGSLLVNLRPILVTLGPKIVP
ncbi:hypothetical protein C923_04315 [Plasmodium falciparum UGT5.1]|uniref:Uncharacterized protein n=1 Tax=Plasmodium falciparum UGT5.1 TaxID=1237627 RepID=W7J8U2_PLAFA|nr:hypothetical protein C923_04315 [Plasmodium falciparum UGT5.1]